MTERPDIIGDLEEERARAKAWFEDLRNEICAEFKHIEHELVGPMSDRAPGRFVQTPWTRTDHTGAPGGGGVMSLTLGEARSLATDLLTAAGLPLEEEREWQVAQLPEELRELVMSGLALKMRRPPVVSGPS